ncbi:MAG: oxaloacetate decarboxylase [Rhodospirillaceae bacterium]
MHPGIKLKQLLTKENPLVLPGVYDGLSAAIARHVGFEAVYMSGAAVSYSTLGKPDIGLTTMTEMVEHASNIFDATGQAIVADADTGFGNALNVMRTVKAYEKAGVACIQIEDQVMPKRCGHMSGKAIIPADEMVGKIKAACDARVCEDFMIMARTDARAVSGPEEAIERGYMYKEAGADALFLEAPQNQEEMRRFCQAFRDIIMLANMVEGGRTPILPLKTLKEIGYSWVIYPGACARIVAKALTGLYGEIRKKGSTAEYLDHMFVFGELNEILRLSELREQEKSYA